MILNKRIERKYMRRKAIRDWWFRHTKLRKMRKRIRKLFYKEQVKHDKPINEIVIYSHAFKMDKDKIEYGLEMFKERGEILSYTSKKVENHDGYWVVFPSENRSQSRILAYVPEEIDLNQVKTEPINKNSSAESAPEENPEPIQPEQTSSPENDNKPF